MFDKIIGRDKSLLAVLDIARQLSDVDAIAIINGESGTGKELVARAIHANGARRQAPFVALNCGGMSNRDLLDSDLFGHVRGAFTGAIAEKPGWLERANGGTLFLDEVGDMPPALQVKLLRVLETCEFSPVGSTKLRSCDVRVLAATHKNLEKLVSDGEFREDLFYRLNVIDLLLPPLRERGSDINLLIDHFVGMFARQYGKSRICISGEARSLLLTYAYPGNIRELRNIINRAIILASDNAIEPCHLPEKLGQSRGNLQPVLLSDFHSAKQGAVELFEKRYIETCLQVSGGNVAAAARTAGLHVTNLHSKIKKYKIDVYFFKHHTEASRSHI